MNKMRDIITQIRETIDSENLNEANTVGEDLRIAYESRIHAQTTLSASEMAIRDTPIQRFFVFVTYYSLSMKDFKESTGRIRRAYDIAHGAL